MFRRTGPIPADRVSALLLAGWLAAALPAEVLGQQVANDDRGAGPEAKAYLEAAKTVDELVRLGKQFALQRKSAAAGLCVEKICAIQPELLTSSERQSPRAWNEFWFNHRAALREQKLAKDDAVGRVKLATWLHEAGMTTAAGEMLKAALAIDRNLTEAQELAEQWNLFGGGPMQFDLSYGLTEPLLRDAFKDEGQDMTLRREHGFLLVPFAYDPGDKRLTINKMYLKIKSDEGRACPVKGIVLLEGSLSSAGTSSRSGARAERSSLRLQADNAPLWERLQIEQNPEQDGYQLTCFNTTHPVVRRAPDERRSGGRSGSSSARKRASGDAKKTTKGGGFFAFLVEVPKYTKFVDCVARGGSKMRLDMEFLEVLARPAEEISAPGGEELLDKLAAQASADQSAIVSAVVMKLATLLPEGRRGRRTSDEFTEPDAITRKIDRALLTAIQHPDRRVRRHAFEVMILSTTSLNESSLAAVQAPARAAVLSAVLDQIEASLRSVADAEGEDAPTPARPSFPGDDSNLITSAVGALPASPASPNVFAALSACLKSDNADVRDRVLDVALADGTQQAVAALVDAPRDTREALTARLAKVDNDELKAAVLRVMLIRAEPDSLSDLLAACGNLAVTITSENDPLLTRLAGQCPPDAVGQLLALLARSDLDAVAGSNVLKGALETLLDGQKEASAVRSAVLELALAQFHPPYEAPVKRESSSRGRRGQTAGPAGFEPILARLAMDPKTDRKMARAAAAALVTAGRLTALKNEFQQSSDNSRGQDLVQALAGDKRLRQREALPVFLALVLIHSDSRTVQLALASLALIRKATDPPEQWRLNLAVKQGVEPRQLVKLTLHADEKISRPATELLRHLAMLTSDEVHEFRLIEGERARADRLKSIEKERSEKPAGRFACRVYLDVQPADSGAGSRGGAPAAGRRSIPLTSLNVDLQRSGEGSTRIVADGKDIALSRDRPRGSRARRSKRVSLWIDPAPLLRAALSSGDAEKEGLAGKVGPPTGELKCQLEYEQWGTWGGKLTGLSSRRGTTGENRPLRITGAKIILEPLTQ